MVKIYSNNVSICGIAVNTFIDENHCIKEIENFVFKNNKKLKIYFINAHVVNIANTQEAFKNCLQKGSLILPDGFGIWLAGKLLHGVSLLNLNGTDFGIRLLEWASHKNLRVFLLGANFGIADLAKVRLQNMIEGLNIVGCHNGYFNNYQEEQLIDEINSLKVDLLVVCFGVPKQEFWIERNAGKLITTKIILGMGAFLDFYSGRISRAPLFIRKIRMEWCYRLLLEPRRLWKRYIIGNGLFIFQIIKSKLKCSNIKYFQSN